jgi:hypothetical protein
LRRRKNYASANQVRPPHLEQKSLRPESEKKAKLRLLDREGGGGVSVYLSKPGQVYVHVSLMLKHSLELQMVSKVRA